MAKALTLANSEAESSNLTGLDLAAPFGIQVSEVIMVSKIRQKDLQMVQSIEGIGCKMQLASLNLWWTNQSIPKTPKFNPPGAVHTNTVALIAQVTVSY